MSDVDSYRFYQGKYTHTIRLSRHERRWWTRRLYYLYLRLNLGQRRRSFLQRSVSRTLGSVLDLGCGGGNEFLTTMGSVVGVDLSWPSALRARGIYGAAVCADIAALPLPDNSFDYVVSLDVLGHIPLTEKTAAYREMTRVLKPRGRMTHAAVETDSCNIWFRFAKHYPELFDEVFVERHGHFGLETPTEAITRFRELGLRPIREDKIHDTVWPIGEYAYTFEEHFMGKSKLVDWIVTIDKVLARVSYVKLLVNCVLTPFAWLVDQWQPWDSAQGVLVCYEKPTSNQ